MTRAPTKSTRRQVSLNEEVEEVVASLKRNGTKKVREGMARYAIPSDKAFGVSVGNLQKLAKRVRGPDAAQNHALAAGLWASGWYEARMMACYVDDPACVTAAQMDQWCQGFDNWAICDTACFALFDRTPHAWRKVKQWSKSKEEFVRRAAFALLWGLTVHDKRAGAELFADGLVLIERAASDERHFVKKGVNMALRAVGKRSPALCTAAIAVAQRLAASPDATPRWIGKDALRELTSASVTRRLAGRSSG
jgi:3-methyladenine DNA glycosylase AlkD